MTVYHGSVQTITMPDVMHSYRALDFGRGFYVTTNFSQAEKWANRKSVLYATEKRIVNIYEMKDNIENLRIKKFSEDMAEWLDFVCDCRDGKEIYLDYDIVIGKIADDKVFRVVDMYHTGVWDRERALKEIKIYPSYDQIAFISQRAIDQLLVFKPSKEV